MILCLSSIPSHIQYCWSNEAISQLHRLVKAYPALWKVDDLDYHNELLQNKLWAEISGLLVGPCEYPPEVVMDKFNTHRAKFFRLKENVEERKSTVEGYRDPVGTVSIIGATESASVSPFCLQIEQNTYLNLLVLSDTIERPY